MSLICGTAVHVYELWNLQHPEKMVYPVKDTDEKDEKDEEREKEFVTFAHNLTRSDLSKSPFRPLRCGQVRGFPFKRKNLTDWKVVIRVDDNIVQETRRAFEKFPEFNRYVDDNDLKFYVVETGGVRYTE